MTLESINKILEEQRPENFILASFSQKNRQLIIACTFEGGPNEDRVLLVIFEQAAIFAVQSAAMVKPVCAPESLVLVRADSVRIADFSSVAVLTG